MHRVRIVEATQCDVPMEILLAAGRFSTADLPTPSTHRDADGSDSHQGHDGEIRLFETWSYESDQPMSLDALRTMVQRELPVSVYRCKGIVFAADTPRRRHALQIVGRRTEITDQCEWGDRAPRTQIVAIGTELDAEEWNDKFNSCTEQH
jgi:G3E family GTPase